MDELAWIAASLEFPGCTMVTLAMDRIEFRHAVRCGAILRIEVRHARTGTTSADYAVRVFADEPGDTDERDVFGTTVTLVRVDEAGKPCPLGERRPRA